MASSTTLGCKGLLKFLRRLFCWGKKPKESSGEPIGYEAATYAVYEGATNEITIYAAVSLGGLYSVSEPYAPEPQASESPASEPSQGTNEESTMLIPAVLKPMECAQIVGPVLRRVVFEDGNVHTLDGPKTKLEFQKILGTLSPRMCPMPNGMGMVLDDFAFIKNRAENDLATLLYQNQCKLPTVQVIYGPVAIIPQSDFT